MDRTFDRHEFGDLLRNLRLRLGVTQRQLADLSTVSVRAIRDLEQGRSQRPRKVTVRLIASGLGLSSGERARFEAAAGSVTTIGDLKELYDAKPVAPPAVLDTLIGRDTEVSALREALRAGGQRLVTVTGLCGVGKTRIALEVAGQLHEAARLPVLWHSASDVSGMLWSATPSDHLSALLRAGLSGLVSPVDCPAELGQLIGMRPALLVLDGYEADTIRIDRLLALVRECRGLRVLSAARASFGIPGERTFHLGPLAVPASSAGHSVTGLAGVAAVRLLVRYARQVQPDFAVTARNAAHVVELCRLLDGIPAALEGAAAWLLVYSPDELCEHVRANPFDIAGDRTAALGDHLRSSLSCLDCVEAASLDRLTDEWSVCDVSRLTGLSPLACAELVRRLLGLGLVRPVDGAAARFRTLALVRWLTSSTADVEVA
ncbi:MAG TPA: helix-turn-helix domain-containing protein [Pseudonocardiaceae bacterium]|nr:helix-turn-helix domain-containing protein [Pseudonocardiaceae bacterium]